jgi:hypothetical protein
MGHRFVSGKAEDTRAMSHPCYSLMKIGFMLQAQSRLPGPLHGEVEQSAGRSDCHELFSRLFSHCNNGRLSCRSTLT